MKKYTTEVINSEGTLAIMRDGRDVLYVKRAVTANHRLVAKLDSRREEMTDEEHQRLVAVIVEAFKKHE